MPLWCMIIILILRMSTTVLRGVSTIGQNHFTIDKTRRPQPSRFIHMYSINFIVDAVRTGAVMWWVYAQLNRLLHTHTH